MLKSRKLAHLGLSALLLTGVGAIVTTAVIPAVATQRNDPKKAASLAEKARKALAKSDWVKAVSYAESAVAYLPTDANYRLLLGTGYLRAGRFTSAHSAFADVLKLDPENGKAALNLALVQIAEGQWADARQMLDDHQQTIGAADRGLAVALSGDPAAAVEILTAATRAPEADVKTRQNLALAMALAGRWQEARALIGVDMSPADADARIIEWANFARPSSSAQQVASLLGVTQITDPGQPIAIALNGAVPVEAVPVAVVPQTAATETVAVAVAQVPVVQTKIVEPVPVAAPVAVVAPVEVAVSAPEVIPTTPAVTFAPRREVVQQLPAVQPGMSVAKVATLASSGAYKTRVAAPNSVAAAPAKGNYVVQLGAFSSAAVAKDGWSRATRRFSRLSSFQPTGMDATVNGAKFYRLSVAGIARADAVGLCRNYRAAGGTCFVRQNAGDQLASWVKPGRSAVQLASR